MSKDNLLLFPKKSKSLIEMTEAEVKWTITGTLVLILALSLGLNGAILKSETAKNTNVAQVGQDSRQLASISPLMNISWEKRAFELLENVDERDLASVGREPSPFDKLSFGVLEGKYAIQLQEGKISQIQFAQKADSKPKIVADRSKFLSDYRGLMAPGEGQIKQVMAESNGEMMMEKYQFVSAKGQALATVQLLMDSEERLISLTVQ